MSLSKRSLFITSLLYIVIFPGLSFADCSCQMGSNGIYYIGIEHIATGCPPDPPSDDHYYHYIDYAVRCPGNTVLNWAFWGNTSRTPQSLGDYYVNQGYRVLRNTSGTHIIGVSPNFQGIIAGVNFAGLAPGVYDGDLNEYCCHLPGNVYACSSSLPDDKDHDGWPVCFDCDDNNPEYTNNCPEIETPKNLGNQRCVTHSFAGNPINVGTGNKYQKEVDISSVPTPLGLEFTRHYNSQSEVSRSTGYGWSHTHDRHLSFEQGKIVAWREDGRAIFFSEDTLEPESGAKERLTLNLDNSFTLVGSDQIRETYDSSGNLINIYDLNGNTVSLNYQDGKLIQVIGPFGRSMGFTYDDSGHISDVTDPAGNTVRYEYDANDNLIRIIYPDTSTREYIYNDPNDIHNLTGIVDETGVRFATYAYDDKDRAILSTQAGDAGRIDVSYEADCDPDKIKVTDGRGNITTFLRTIIQGIALSQSVTGPGCSACGNRDVEYSYDDVTLNLLSKTDGNGVTSQYGNYDSWGNAQTVTHAFGLSEERTISKTYDPNLNKITSITQPSTTPSQNKVTTYTYNQQGNLLGTAEAGFANGSPVTRIITYTYNAHGQITQIDGPRTDVNDITTFTYDNMGNLACVTKPLSGSTVYSDYDELGRVGKMIDPNGLVTTFSYDTRGRITQIDRGGAITQYQYYSTGKLRTSIGPAGEVLSYSYDDAQRLIEISDNQGNRMVYTLNAEGEQELEQIFDPEDIQVKTLGRAFDAYNRLESLTQPHGTTIYGYDNNSNLTEVTDAKDNTTTYIYDSLNRIKEVIEPSPDGNSTSPVTSYEHDIQDHVIKIKDANNHITLYEYDDFGNLLKAISPDTGITSTIFDEAGNIISRTDAKNNTTTYTYDALNRLTGIHCQDSTQDITYTYDQGTYGKGRLTGMTDPGGVYVYTYDIFGNLIQEDKIIDDQTYSTCYTYDEAYHLTSITYPDGLIVSYDLDETDKIREISITKGVLSQTLASNIHYLPFGPLTGLTYGNGNEMTKTFDQAYRLNSIHTGSIQNLSYTLDAANSITSITDNLDPLHSQSFNYDSLYRLTSAEGVYGAIDYSYDLVGNRLSKYVDAETDIYSYDTGTNRLLEITGSNPMAFSYDENGNTVNMGNKGFAFNQNNRMIQASVDGASTAGYTYNGFDQRIKKTAGDITTIYHYDQSGNLISESGEDVIDYIYLGNTRIAAVLSPTGECQGDLDNDGDVDGSDLAVFAADFGRKDCDTWPPCDGDFDGDNDVDSSDLAVFSGDFGRTDCQTESVYYYHNDHLGTPQKMTDVNGAAVWNVDYRPFGRADVTVNTIANNFRFPGQYWDQESGLHYNWHRYYDPGIGRYLRADPLNLSSIQIMRQSSASRILSSVHGPYTSNLDQIQPFLLGSLLYQYSLMNPQVLNVYSYVQNDPVKRFDTEGLFSTCPEGQHRVYDNAGFLECFLLDTETLGVCGACVGFGISGAGSPVAVGICAACLMRELYCMSKHSKCVCD